MGRESEANLKQAVLTVNLWGSPSGRDSKSKDGCNQGRKEKQHVIEDSRRRHGREKLGCIKTLGMYEGTRKGESNMVRGNQSPSMVSIMFHIMYLLLHLYLPLMHHSSTIWFWPLHLL